ncbi:hypothetical protein LY90DRAFT_511775 [Neocallimastix californiae]|uniref:HECT domain-containing protein n=1 Tax=Neocallimastix californiae TaxID=1754190 RepID=A0A1Y2BK38_9FUNG|nr:hypothetical protein LY90DRAFT_511775 [Neocallimastix californiae]|eukprot:ORY35134.1 hypothetical protein LY90DRAFT_511775 [Neocallimastix californiae]
METNSPKEGIINSFEVLLNNNEDEDPENNNKSNSDNNNDAMEIASPSKMDIDDIDINNNEINMEINNDDNNEDNNDGDNVSKKSEHENNNDIEDEKEKEKVNENENSKINEKQNEFDKKGKGENDDQKSNTSNDSDNLILNGVKSFMDHIANINGFPNKSSSKIIPSIKSLNKKSYLMTDVMRWILITSANISEKLHFYHNNIESLFEKVRVLSKELITFDENKVEDLANILQLYQVAQYFADSSKEDYITGYEMIKSGLINALVVYLSEENIMESKKKNIEIIRLAEKNNARYIQRIKAFIHVFLDGPWPYDTPNQYLYVPNSFQNLVKKLQEILSRFENFQLYTGIPKKKIQPFENIHSSNNNISSLGSNDLINQNSALQLVKQIHIKLVSLDDISIIKQISQMSVTVHAIAPFKVIDEFIRAKYYPQYARNEDSKKKKRFSGSFLTRLVHNVQKTASSSSKSKKEKEKENKLFIEFTIGEPDNKEVTITNDTTVFGACWQYEQQNQQKKKSSKGKKSTDNDDIIQSNNSINENVDIWKHSYTIFFRRSMKKSNSLDDNMTIDNDSYNNLMKNDINKKYKKRLNRRYSSSMPSCLSIDTINGKVIFILNILYKINNPFDDFYINHPEILTLDSNTNNTCSKSNINNNNSNNSRFMAFISKDYFINTKITAKLGRQLDEPLIVASNVLPSWCHEIAHNFSFLISFDTRITYLQSTSFGYGRSMNRWQNNNSNNNSSNQRDQSLLGRLQRQKVRVNRNHILESMIKIMPLYGVKNSLLEIEFYNEVGTGLGPTLEFYSLVSNEICKSKYKLWRDTSNTNETSMNSVLEKEKRESINNINEIGNKDNIQSPMNQDQFLDVPDKPGLLKRNSNNSSQSSILPNNESSVTNNNTSNNSTSVEDLRNPPENNKGDNTVNINNEKASHEDTYVNLKYGLFPAPINPDNLDTPAGKKLLRIFNCLGIFVAKAMLDFRTIDLPLNTYFVKLIKDNVNNLDFSELYCLSSNKNYLEMGLKIIEQVDPPLVNSLNQIMKYSNIKKEIYSNTSLSPDELHTMVQNIKIDDTTIQDLCLDFTLPGYPDIELVENGSQVDVTNWNVEEYLKEIINFTIGKGVSKQIEAFRKGFNSVFPISNLSIFDNDELVLLFGGSENEDWSYENLINCIHADHGYTMDSPQIIYLVQVMSEMNDTEKRDFIQFVTGCPKLPLGGFKNLNPPFTVVCKTTEASHKPDEYLPSVMTCANYLKIPQYSSKDVLKEKLEIAYKEGRGCFHLS